MPARGWAYPAIPEDQAERAGALSVRHSIKDKGMSNTALHMHSTAATAAVSSRRARGAAARAVSSTGVQKEPEKTKKKRHPLTQEARTRIEQSREVARFDMATALASLFRPVRGRARREIVQEQEWMGATIRFRSIELSDFDLGVLLAILSLAFQRDSMAEECLPGEGGCAGNQWLIEGERLRVPDNYAMQNPVVNLTTSIRRVCKSMGIPEAGDSWRSVKISIERLSMVIMAVEAGRGRDRRWATTRLIAASVGHGDMAGISLNYRLARALLGNGSYAAISMADYRMLPSGIARLAYTWLTAWFASKIGTRRIGLEALERHIYGSPSSDRKTRSKRRLALKAGIEALRLIGWGVEWEKDGEAVEIERRRGANTKATEC